MFVIGIKLVFGVNWSSLFLVFYFNPIFFYSWHSVFVILSQLSSPWLISSHSEFKKLQTYFKRHLLLLPTLNMSRRLRHRCPPRRILRTQQNTGSWMLAQTDSRFVCKPTNRCWLLATTNLLSERERVNNYKISTFFTWRLSTSAPASLSSSSSLLQTSTQST